MPAAGHKRIRHAGGRPPKLTTELTERICQLMRAGNYLETAANVAGVSSAVVHLWLRAGARNGKPRYRRFFEAVRKAEHEAIASGVVRVRQHGSKSWQAEAWWLERRCPRQWGRRDPDQNAAARRKHRDPTLAEQLKEVNIGALSLEKRRLLSDLLAECEAASESQHDKESNQ